MNVTSTRFATETAGIREMAPLHREPHLEPFRFLIKRDRDGRHRWSLYNASGTVIGRHTAGFSSELEARHDVQRVRDELADAPIIGESVPKGASTELVGVDGAAIRSARHETGGTT